MYFFHFVLIISIALAAAFNSTTSSQRLLSTNKLAFATTALDLNPGSIPISQSAALISSRAGSNWFSSDQEDRAFSRRDASNKAQKSVKRSLAASHKKASKPTRKTSSTPQKAGQTKKASKSVRKTTSHGQKAGKTKKHSSSANGRHENKANSGSSSKGTPLPQLIRPKKGTTYSAQKEFESTVKRVAGSKVISTPTVEGKGILFWQVYLTEEQVKELKKNPVVGSIVPDVAVEGSLDAIPPPHSSKHNSDGSKAGKHNTMNPAKHSSKSKSKVNKRSVEMARNSTTKNLQRRADGSRLLPRVHDEHVQVQFKAPWELESISQYHTASEHTGLYFYDKSAGKGVMIYGIDSGLNKDHIDVEDWLDSEARPKLRWIYSDKTRKAQYDDDQLDGHGSCVWDKAVGPFNGVAKSASYTVVKVGKTYRYVKDHRTIQELVVSEGEMFNALVKVCHDIVKRKEEANPENPKGAAPSVISLSLNFFTGLPENRAADLQALEDFKGILRYLSYYQVPVVYAAANLAKNKKFLDVNNPLNELTKEFDNFFLVGATNYKGQIGSARDADPSNPVINVWAPGLELTCIKPRGHGTWTMSKPGTSYATPMVAGLVAYAMALPGGPRTPAEVGKWLEENARKRVSGGPKTIANELRWEEHYLAYTKYVGGKGLGHPVEGGEHAGKEDGSGQDTTGRSRAHSIVGVRKHGKHPAGRKKTHSISGDDIPGAGKVQ